MRSAEKLACHPVGRGPVLISSQSSPKDARAFETAGHLIEVASAEDTSAPHTDTQDHRGQIPAPRRSGWQARHYKPISSGWPLLAVLAVQTLLSARLVWSNSAFQDEALYLRAGHLEWARLLHQAPVPSFPSYFSGAPVLYPPLGALADSVDGLAAARLLSLCFMLGVTSLLWATSTRLYGQRAGLLAAALFATLAGTQFLGALATFDALALLLLALAVWLAVRSADARHRSRTALLIAAGVVLAAADAVKYATALFTPIVLVVVALAAWRRRPGQAWLTGLLIMLGAWLVPVIAAVACGGHNYWLGITTTTLGRPRSDAAVTAVLKDAYIWTSLLLVLALLGSVLAIRSRTRARFLPAILTAAALLVPIEQARLQTTVSLQKHVVFGAWFAAIAAGYGMARLSRVDPGRGWAAVLALPIAANTLFGSMGQATALHNVWPNASGLIQLLHSEVRSHPGHYLAEDYDVEAYYLRTEVPWQHWSNTYYFSYRGITAGPPSFTAAIDSHYFSLVILNFGDTAATDSLIRTDMHHAGGYYILARSGHFIVWATHTPITLRATGGHDVHH